MWVTIMMIGWVMILFLTAVFPLILSNNKLKMSKQIIYSVIVIAMLGIKANIIQAQKLYTKAGKISFHSKAPLEEIKAVNKSVTAILDTKTGMLQFSVLIKGFEFEKALMQEHFNENYMESDKYPKATFCFRLGFDYGLTDNLTLGIGRSTFQKELDGLIKWRIIHQSRGRSAFPVSVIWVSGITVNTTKVSFNSDKRSVSDRTGYYHEVIIGRKFNDIFTLQLNPIWVHRNRITANSEDDLNDVFALGTGLRVRLTRRVSLVADYDYVFHGLENDVYKNPLAIGFDIETGGHVFQLHFSNSEGLNDNAFITHTTRNWGKGEINFGFNLSRVFSIKKKRIE